MRVKRFIQFLALLALILAPAALHRAEALPHHVPAATDSDHCGGSRQPVDEDRRERNAADCAMACSAMPGACAQVEAAPSPASPYLALPAPFFAGTAPGSDPPPPRAP